MTVELPARAVLFDMDGTLVDSADAIADTWTTYARSRSLDVDEVLALLPGRTARDIVAACRPGLAAVELSADLEWIRTHETASTVSVRAIDGAAGLTSALDAGRWAVVTAASRPMMRARLTAAGLPLPAVSVCADDVTEGKPSPEGFLLAAERLGVPATACVVLEDSDAGLVAGRRAGAACVAVGGGTGLADAAVEDLTGIAVGRRDDGYVLRILPSLEVRR